MRQARDVLVVALPPKILPAAKLRVAGVCRSNSAGADYGDDRADYIGLWRKLFLQQGSYEGEVALAPRPDWTALQKAKLSASKYLKETAEASISPNASSLSLSDAEDFLSTPSCTTRQQCDKGACDLCDMRCKAC